MSGGEREVIRMGSEAFIKPLYHHPSRKDVRVRSRAGRKEGDEAQKCSRMGRLNTNIPLALGQKEMSSVHNSFAPIFPRLSPPYLLRVPWLVGWERLH